MLSTPPKPVPVPDALSEEFWAATAEHRLAMQQCRSCGWLAYPPRTSCVSCRADPPAFRWSPVSGRGRVQTWTVVRTAFLPGFAADVPYVVADIELEEQPRLRMAAGLRGIERDAIEIGMPVQVAFEDMEGGVSIPYFVPRGP